MKASINVKPRFKVGDQVRRLDTETHKWSRGTVVSIKLNYPLMYIIHDNKRDHEYGSSAFHIRLLKGEKET